MVKHVGLTRIMSFIIDKSSSVFNATKGTDKKVPIGKVPAKKVPVKKVPDKKTPKKGDELPKEKKTPKKGGELPKEQKKDKIDLKSKEKIDSKSNEKQFPKIEKEDKKTHHIDDIAGVKTGYILSVKNNIVVTRGLPNVKAGELLYPKQNIYGMALNKNYTTLYNFPKLNSIHYRTMFRATNIHTFHKFSSGSSFTPQKLYIPRKNYYGSRPQEKLFNQNQSKGQSHHPCIYKRQCTVCYNESPEINDCYKDFCHLEDTLVAVATSSNKLPNGQPTLLLDSNKNLAGESKAQHYNPIPHEKRYLPAPPIYDIRLNSQKIISILEQEKYKIKDNE